MTQISTSVKERTEDVALTPRAGTLWVASSVLVNEDTREMESSAKVRQLKEYCTLSCISYRENYIDIRYPQMNLVFNPSAI